MERGHVALEQCYVCMKDVGVLLHKRLAPVLPHRMCVSREPCAECKTLMQHGVILISIDESKTTDVNNPWRTGGWVVLKDEAIRRIVTPPELAESILSKRMAFVPDDAWCTIGLPGIKRVRDHECRACGAKWTRDVVFVATPNLSGEETPLCPQCGSRASSSNPCRYIRDEGTPARNDLPAVDGEGRLV